MYNLTIKRKDDTILAQSSIKHLNAVSLWEVVAPHAPHTTFQELENICEGVMDSEYENDQAYLDQLVLNFTHIPFEAVVLEADLAGFKWEIKDLADSQLLTLHNVQTALQACGVSDPQMQLVVRVQHDLKEEGMSQVNPGINLSLRKARRINIDVEYEDGKVEDLYTSVPLTLNLCKEVIENFWKVEPSELLVQQLYEELKKDGVSPHWTIAKHLTDRTGPTLQHVTIKALTKV